MTTTPMTDRRTIRRYAHELYPHAEDGETRALAVEVPYLYAQAIGLNVWGTSWHDDRSDVGCERAILRHIQLASARHVALLGDALLQGMAGQEAWEWADQRAWDETGEWVCERAMRYGVPVERIKPYPCGPEPDHHDHMESTGDVMGYGVVARIDCPESACPTCTESPCAECERLRGVVEALAAKLDAVRAWIDRRGVNVGDRDDDYMHGYRDAQRHALLDAHDLRRVLDAPGVAIDGYREDVERLRAAEPIVRTVGDLTARHQLTRPTIGVNGRVGELKVVKPFEYPGRLTLIWGDWWEDVVPDTPCEVLG